ncbi:hypothetical protein [Desulfofundulus sp.]|uniref:hypothetical protein n=1 Tax=Desulfofundulus sp. TaxID=2282750 RepID=UPI003C708C0B
MPDVVEKPEVGTKATSVTEVFAGIFMILIGLLLIRFGFFFAGALVTVVGLVVLAF